MRRKRLWLRIQARTVMRSGVEETGSRHLRDAAEAGELGISADVNAQGQAAGDNRRGL